MTSSMRTSFEFGDENRQGFTNIHISGAAVNTESGGF
jgi:hypothetical protein